MLYQSMCAQRSGGIRGPLGERNHVFCMVMCTNICTCQHDKTHFPSYMVCLVILRLLPTTKFNLNAQRDTLYYTVFFV